MKKTSKWVILMLVILASLSLTACGKQKISLSNYVSVVIEGYDGYANASKEIDEVGIDALVEAEKVQKYYASLSNDMLTAEMAKSVQFSDLLSFSIEGDEDGLSNGDTVAVVVKMNDMLSLYGQTFESMQEALGISIETTRIEIKVEGLQEAKVLDVVSFVDDYISISGANGDGGASISFPDDFSYECDGFSIVRYNEYQKNVLQIVYNHDRLETLTYSFSPNGTLSEGDVYTVHANARNTKEGTTLGDTGYILNTTKKMTVPDLGDFVTSKDEITNELKAKFNEVVAGELQKLKVTTTEYYWGELKDSAVTDEVLREGHKIFLLVTYKDWLLGTYHKIFETEHIILNTDGTYDIKVSTKGSFFKEDLLDEDYNLEILEW